ncbi:hypothetical protein [uncultured Rhodoblastus sp.]|uniref:hypothetical protein n=1 Tax=uncultured Rhodoblastus sp. TaxID=543037 RepID=UPI0025E1B4D4|nr:hypothetical protein [uncultured Rhodoblastus sp.]
MRVRKLSSRRILCPDIMSKDVSPMAEQATPDAARSLLLDHGARALPVAAVQDGRSAQSACAD